MAQQRAWGTGASALPLLSPRSSSVLLVSPLEHILDYWTFLYVSTYVTVSQAGLCPETKLEAQAQDYLLITKPPQLA